MNHNFRQLTYLFNYINIKASHIYHASVGTEWRFNDYCHNFNRVYIVLDGSGVLFNENENITMQPGNIYIIPANHRYSCRCDDHLEKFFIHFTATILPQNDLLSGVDKIVTFPISSSEIQSVHDMLYNENIRSALLLQNFIRTLIAKITDPGTMNIDRDIEIFRKYEKLYNYIDNNLYADLSVAEVCRHLGFSQTYIGQKFKTDTGKTIKQHISSLLTERISNLLLFTQMSVIDISKELRFDNESYCSKFFKKHKGMSPREYRKRHRPTLQTPATVS